MNNKPLNIIMAIIVLAMAGCQATYQVVWDSDKTIVDAEFDNLKDAEKYVEDYKKFHEYKISVDYRLSSSLKGKTANGEIYKTDKDENNSQGRLSISK